MKPLSRHGSLYLLLAGLCLGALAAGPAWSAPAPETATPAASAPAASHAAPATSTAPAPAAGSPSAQPAKSSAPAVQAPPQAEAASLAAKVQARYQQIHGLEASYQRKSLFVAAGDDNERTVEGNGQLQWSRPTNLRLVQEEPRKELIVTSQGSVWWVRPQRGRADIYPLDRFTSGLRSLLDALGGLARVDESFTVEPPQEEDHTPDNAGMSILVLKPKEKRSDLKRLVLWFSREDLVLRGFRIISLIGDVTEYRFQQVQVNPHLGPETFNYQAPGDYKVTDHRPQAPTAEPQ